VGVGQAKAVDIIVNIFGSQAVHHHIGGGVIADNNH
jgi:hypothetical protein